MWTNTVLNLVTLWLLLSHFTPYMHIFTYIKTVLIYLPELESYSNIPRNSFLELDHRHLWTPGVLGVEMHLPLDYDNSSIIEWPSQLCHGDKKKMKSCCFLHILYPSFTLWVVFSFSSNFLFPLGRPTTPMNLPHSTFPKAFIRRNKKKINSFIHSQLQMIDKG